MLNEYQSNQTLNPKLWIGDELRPKLREGYIKIASAFYDFLDIEQTPILDIILVGSNANYNWTDFSDIDLHVIVNYLEIGDNLYLVQNYLQAKKSIWNSKYPLVLKDMNIELYAQDLNETMHNSVGVYSLMHDQWIQKPKSDLVIIDDDAISKKARPYVYEIDKLNSEDPDLDERIQDIQTRLRHLRQSGLDAAGEYSIENLAYKWLRNKGYLDRLKDLAQTYTMNQLALESAGHAVNVVDMLAKHVTKQNILDEMGWQHVMRQTNGVRDALGQWEHPGRCTMIPSNQITMKAVPHQVLGIDDTGHMQLMKPEQSYTFPGTQVFEIPRTAQWQTMIMKLVNKIRNGAHYA